MCRRKCSQEITGPWRLLPWVLVGALRRLQPGRTEVRSHTTGLRADRAETHIQEVQTISCICKKQSHVISHQAKLQTHSIWPQVE